MRPCAVCANAPGATNVEAKIRPATANSTAKDTPTDLDCRVIVDSSVHTPRYLLGLRHTPTREQALPNKVKHLLLKEFYKPDSSVPAATKTLTCVRAMLRNFSDTAPSVGNLAPTTLARV
jgi:hypothetical protein